MWTDASYKNAVYVMEQYTRSRMENGAQSAHCRKPLTTSFPALGRPLLVELLLIDRETWNSIMFKTSNFELQKNLISIRNKLH